MFNSRFITVLVLLVFLGLGGFVLANKKIESQNENVTESKITTDYKKLIEEPSITPVPIPDRYEITPGNFVGQTFNNCGPASLSMTLSIFGTNLSQWELASSMRPFNNPQGGVDDKSIFAHEFVAEVERQGYLAIARPSGTMDLLKALVSNDIPVVVRTWLNDKEDIGHFRVVTGYDSVAKTLTYQDSYYGPNQTQIEEAFNTLWQPFNYGYIVVYPKDKEEVVEEIVGENMYEKTAWEQAKMRAEEEYSKYCHPEQSEGSLDSSATPQNDSECAFAGYNLATAEYYLGNYDETIASYEEAVSGLPSRMLWYQPEPIYAYQKIGQYEKAIELADRILQNGNLAYSELYQVKGEIYLEQGNMNLARDMFEKAVYYNSSFQPAKDSLQNLTI